MHIKKRYETYISKLESAREYWQKKSSTNYPLFIHGTFLEKLASIWKDGIEPGGAIPSIDPLFTIPGYVSLQKIEFSARSGHGDITLIIDGMDLDPNNLEYHEQYRHEIHKGNIPIQSILAIDIKDIKNTERAYEMTKQRIPIVIDTDRLILN